MWCDECCNGLLVWRNPRDSAVVFGTVAVVLVALRYVSAVSVIGNCALGLLSAAMAFRIYRSVLSAVNKTNEGNPFRGLLEMDCRVSQDQSRNVANAVAGYINCLLATLKRVFLVESVLDSVKFAVAMYVLIVLGRWMNGLTLLSIIWVKMFTLPKFYKDNQKTIDEALAPIKQKIAELTGNQIVVKKDE